MAGGQAVCPQCWRVWLVAHPVTVLPALLWYFALARQQQVRSQPLAARRRPVGRPSRVGGTLGQEPRPAAPRWEAAGSVASAAVGQTAGEQTMTAAVTACARTEAAPCPATVHRLHPSPEHCRCVVLLAASLLPP